MGRLKVLLVEDDPDSRELLAELLDAEFEIHAAPDAAAGLARFHEVRCDVVVTDQSLPGMEGTELARVVKGLSPSTKVILMSGYSDIGRADFCDRVLGKPLEPATLFSALHELMAVGTETGDAREDPC